MATISTWHSLQVGICCIAGPAGQHCGNNVWHGKLLSATLHSTICYSHWVMVQMVAGEYDNRVVIPAADNLNLTIAGKIKSTMALHYI